MPSDLDGLVYVEMGPRPLVKAESGQVMARLPEDHAACPLHEAVLAALASADLKVGSGVVYLKAGRKVAKMEGW
jgi:tyrosyl-tRNA synthetase